MRTSALFVLVLAHVSPPSIADSLDRQIVEAQAAQRCSEQRLSDAMAGREREARNTCRKLKYEAEPKPYSSSFLALNKDILLASQRQQCQDFGTASGSPKRAERCLERIESAYRFMERMAYASPIPVTGWVTCTDIATHDIELGARCIAAAKEICKADENGVALDNMQCIRIMTSGAWVANPSARNLRL